MVWVGDSMDSTIKIKIAGCLLHLDPKWPVADPKRYPLIVTHRHRMSPIPIDPVGPTLNLRRWHPETTGPEIRWWAGTNGWIWLCLSEVFTRTGWGRPQCLTKTVRTKMQHGDMVQPWRPAHTMAWHRCRSFTSSELQALTFSQTRCADSLISALFNAVQFRLVHSLR
jgi:hypothetical protein